MIIVRGLMTTTPRAGFCSKERQIGTKERHGSQYVPRQTSSDFSAYSIFGTTNYILSSPTGCSLTTVPVRWSTTSFTSWPSALVALNELAAGLGFGFNRLDVRVAHFRQPGRRIDIGGVQTSTPQRPLPDRTNKSAFRSEVLRITRYLVRTDKKDESGLRPACVMCPPSPNRRCRSSRCFLRAYLDEHWFVRKSEPLFCLEQKRTDLVP